VTAAASTTASATSALRAVVQVESECAEHIVGDEQVGDVLLLDHRYGEFGTFAPTWRIAAGVVAA
jgi:hypothetical protein